MTLSLVTHHTPCINDCTTVYNIVLPTQCLPRECAEFGRKDFVDEDLKQVNDHLMGGTEVFPISSRGAPPAILVAMHRQSAVFLFVLYLLCMQPACRISKGPNWQKSHLEGQPPIGQVSCMTTWHYRMNTKYAEQNPNRTAENQNWPDRPYCMQCRG